MNIARLMMSYNFVIEDLPDNLKCAQCKLVLKDACQVPCGCRFCRVCIDEVMEGGDEFCPGDSEDCGESPLSRFATDYVANKSVSRLTVKCPHGGCMHRCQLVNMEEHLRECPRKSEECPFRELGCTQNKLAAEQMGRHLQQDTRRHSEILIGMITNITREIRVLKQEADDSKRQIEMLKHEQLLKDGQIRSIMDRMIHVQNENESIKNDIKSIKEENADLADQVRILSEQSAERRKTDDLNSANRPIEHVDKEIAAVKRLIASNKNVLDIEMKSLRGDIGSINQGVNSMTDDVHSLKSHLQSTEMLVGRVDASCDWLISDDLHKITWDWGGRESECFHGARYPYTFQLRSKNVSSAGGVLTLELCVHNDSDDHRLVWPFIGRAVVIVSDTMRSQANSCQSVPMHFDRPSEGNILRGRDIVFRYSELLGFKLGNGVCVTCVIVPGSGR